ncbi:MAG: MFS transporter [Actinobacteria bacterium]|nr:MFS transporter [Actinomycetota bacterium]
MLTSYKRLFAVPGGWNFSLAGFILRMPISMLYIAIVLFVVAETGSYSLAGGLSMVASLVLSVATPLWSRAADQFGQNRVLAITAPVHLFFLGLFVYLVKSDAPNWSWFTSAIIFEGFVIGSGQMVRRRWIHVIGDDRKLIDTAYSFEALVDEVIYTSGPALTAITASYFFPEAAIFTAMGFVAVGALLFLTQRGTQPPAHPRQLGDDHPLLIRDRFVQALFIPMMMCGAFFGGTGLVIVAYLDEFGVREHSGFFVAIWSFSSGISAFVSGSIHWKINEARRFIISIFALALLTAPILMAAQIFTGDLTIMAMALFVNGLAIAPLLTAGFTVAERSVGPKRTTEVLAWSISALNLGGAIPTAITGYIIDTYGSTVAFVVPVACILIALLSLLPFLRLWKAKVIQL